MSQELLQRFSTEKLADILLKKRSQPHNVRHHGVAESKGNTHVGR
jgi:hypothetical protein